MRALHHMALFATASREASNEKSRDMFHRPKE